MIGAPVPRYPRDAGPPLWYEDAVGKRQLGGGVPVEHELVRDHRLVHRPLRRPAPRDMKSCNAWLTTAEIVCPDALAYPRT